MLLGKMSVLGQTRVTPFAPALVLLAGLTWLALGHQEVGIGVGLGALLAYLNGVVLSRRIDLAAATGNVGGAMIVMQVGLLVTMTIVAVATVVLIQFSLALTLACAAGFAVTHLAILAAFYLFRARYHTPSETHAA